MEKEKPSWFTLLDAASFGAAAVIVTAITVWAMGSGVSGQPLALLWVVAATFTGIYLRVLWLRKKFLDEWDWIPSMGMMIKRNGYEANLDELANVAKNVSFGWCAYFGEIKVHRAMSKVVWVIFDPDLDTHPPSGHVPAKGYSVVKSFVMRVDFDDPNDPVEKTAFGHELGHLIQGHVTGEWDQETHHERAKDLGLP